MRRLLLVLWAAALGCAAPHRHDDARPTVLVTVPPQAHVVERVAGDLVRVESLLQGGGDPHHHEPGFHELHAVAEAAVWVKVGHPDFGFERAWAERLLEDSPGLVVVDGAAGATLIPGDAHLWLSPANAARVADGVAEALSDLLPEHAGAIEANRAAFVAETEALHADLRALLAPARGRWFLVLHPAWGYLVAEHGLEQVAVESEGRKPDPKTLADLIARGKAAGLETVFVEPQFDPSAAKAIADELGARIVAIDPLARDWDANLRRVAAELAAGSAS